jgi:acyl-CoA synthetase (AMP-forming)/AMP-acid ligase II
MQANVLTLVGVSHLFVVPQIRSSSYLEMLAEKFPDLRNSSPGTIQDPSLPELRNLVVVDNTGQFTQEANKLGLKSWIDWREIMVWDASSRESDLQKDISKSLHKDDVINLQFTRYFSPGSSRSNLDTLSSGTTGAPKAVSVRISHHRALCLLRNSVRS